jgi:APA family basic amino acid/polyamine antiporter
MIPLEAKGTPWIQGSEVAAVAGEMIAVGIFLTPAGMIKSIGSPLWLLILWLAMGVMALSGAFCYGLDLAH